MKPNSFPTRPLATGMALLFAGALALSVPLVGNAVEGYVPPTAELPFPEIEPPIVTPKPFGAAPSKADRQAFEKAGGKWTKPSERPADAIVLFDGEDLSKWRPVSGTETKWRVEDGAFLPVPKAGYIRTKEEFGDCQLHIEWATPSKVEGDGQGRGNSGVFFGNQQYEIQILDSFENKTYFHGQAGSIYKQHPPRVNACRPPGEWQTYDIIYRAPRFDENGKLLKTGRFTVLHNSILIHDHAQLLGRTSHKGAPKYHPHPVKGFIALQDHGNPVRFRNVWLRPLSE